MNPPTLSSKKNTQKTAAVNTKDSNAKTCLRKMAANAWFMFRGLGLTIC